MNDIPVTANGKSLRAAWAGGLNSPQFSSVDLDNDGTKDLVIFDRGDDRLLTFLNGGTADSVDYDFAPEYIAQFPADLSKWVLMRDYDGDGYEDIFTSLPATSNIRVFRNISATNGGVLAFTLAEDTIITDYPGRNALYAPKTDIPAITDIDEDGDLDILSFGVGGKYVDFHRNMSMEDHGDLDHLEYIAQSRCFGHFEEDASTCIPYPDLTPCGPGQRMAADAFEEVRTGLHAGSTLLAIDLGGDSIKELIVGDVDCTTFYAMNNSGTLDVAHFDFFENGFPSQDVPVDVLEFPAAFYMDVDNDGLRDLISAPNQVANIADVSGVWWHKNEGTATVPDFKFVKTGLVQDEMIETGTSTAPAFLDHNGDGRMDMLVGNLGRFDSVNDFVTSLQLWENVGTAAVPAYELVDADYLGIATNAAFADLDYIVPAPGDLDGDGDPDLLLGDASGDLLYFENVATAGNPANFVLVTTTFQNINRESFSSPELYDMDGDADLDLLIGDWRGRIHYLENTGTTSMPQFTVVTDTFGLIKINNAGGDPSSNGYAKPRMVDYDNDGTGELLVGTVEGEVRVFDNVVLTPGSTFTDDGNLFGADFGRYSSIAAAVLDSSRLSYVCGHYSGGLTLMRYGGPVSAEAPVVLEDGEMVLYPNPVSERLKIEVRNLPAQSFSVAVWNMAGQRVYQGSMRGMEGEVDVSGLRSGLYFVRVEGKNAAMTGKIVVQ
ncbi:MAG: T9SS type A sorting domain-containing protein [Bacteroidota bacterium]